MTIQEPIYITSSKKKCKEAGMDPSQLPSPKRFMSREELFERRKSYSEILNVVSLFSNKLLNSLRGTPLLVVISDAEGYLLDIVGDQTIKSAIETFGIKEGSLFTQEDTGTNVISIALEQRHPISLIGDHHFHQALHEIACYGAAFHYTDENSLLGSICIMMPISFQNPLYLTMLSQSVDTIERELLLRKQNRKLDILNQIMLSRTRNGIVITDEKGITIEFNEFAQKISNLNRESVIGKCIFDSPITGKYFQDVIHHGMKFDNEEIKFVNQSGNQIVCLFDAQPMYEGEKLTGAFGQFRDITERYLIEEKYNFLAYHDDLTGLPNRRFIQKEIDALLKREHTIRNPNLALLFLDLDRFKVINDTFGHSKGDLLLIEVAKRLIQFTGENVKLARMGGDEFVFLLQDYRDENSVTEFAKHVLDQFIQPYIVDSNEFHTTVSIGVAIYSENIHSLEDFMVFADNAMYKAKDLGKNQYVVFTSEMFHSTLDELRLENDLRRAIERKEFVLHYQPQICIKTGKMVGVEALIRWKHPELGMIFPDKFIKLAEDTGMISQIGEFVIEEACIQNKNWQNAGLEPFKISVNLSTQQFIKQNLVDFIRDTLHKTSLEPKYLGLEITESMAMDFEYSLKILGELKELGVCISIDDFGTGYSSLNYLKKFQIDFLKIDKSFINDLTENNSDADIVKAIINIAHNLSLEVIAEGVETQAQLDFLKKLNCDIVQGYFFSKPISNEEVINFIQRFELREREVR